MIQSFEEFNKVCAGPAGTAAGEIVGAFEQWRLHEIEPGKRRTNAELLGELGIPSDGNEPPMIAFLTVQAKAVQKYFPQISPAAFLAIDETGKAMLFGAWLMNRMEKLGGMR
jgi:hypothetical protein